MEKMNLLFSIDDQFVTQLKTAIYSIVANTQNHDLAIYVLQKEQLARTDELAAFCEKLGLTYHPIIIADRSFADAPVSERYPETIYYRLLAHEYLPSDLSKILYLDADILCINDLETLYNIEIGEYLYAAASHSQLTKASHMVNKVRLRTYESDGYFNSGILLMNLAKLRATVKRETIFEFIENNKLILFLPDQDILNALYESQILAIPDQLYNYDVRNNTTYLFISKGEWNQNWVMEHTVILHFCGKEKPWQSEYMWRFGSLYKHYEAKAKKVLGK